MYKYNYDDLIKELQVSIKTCFGEEFFLYLKEKFKSSNKNSAEKSFKDNYSKIESHLKQRYFDEKEIDNVDIRIYAILWQKSTESSLEKMSRSTFQNYINRFEYNQFNTIFNELKEIDLI